MDLAPSIGFLDAVTRQEGVLNVAGWAASPVPGTRLERLQILAGGHELTEGRLEAHLPSPDVLAAGFGLYGAEAARFRFTLPLREEDRTLEVRDSLLWIRPWFQGRPGPGWFRIIDPSLPQPSRKHVRLVGGEFLGPGLATLGHLVEKADLGPSEAVLDVGCGPGRVAYALTYYLDGAARYEGFDVVAPMISWARRQISSRFPGFRFQAVDVRNRAFNPRGRLRPADWSFPYPACPSTWSSWPRCSPTWAAGT
jgi:hypothetical protein